MTTTLSTTTTHDAPLAVPFEVPLVNPAPGGLFGAVTWTEETPPLRWLMSGTDFGIPRNYGGAAAFGVWGAHWCNPQPVGQTGTLAIVGDPDGGDWTVTVGEETTVTLGPGVTADDVQDALADLPNVILAEVTAGTDPGTFDLEIVTARFEVVSVDGSGLTVADPDPEADPPSVTIRLTTMPSDHQKIGTRPDATPPFLPLTVWAMDQCDLTDASRAEVRARAQQVLRLEEQTAVERELAARMLVDAGTPAPTDDLVRAVGALEARFAVTNTVGVIHASAELAAVAASSNLLRWTPAGAVSPMGHRWVFGGGYVTGLGSATLVATSPLYGWRSQPELREAEQLDAGVFYAMAERSFVLGYERALGAATITPPTP